MAGAGLRSATMLCGQRRGQVGVGLALGFSLPWCSVGANGGCPGRKGRSEDGGTGLGMGNALTEHRMQLAGAAGRSTVLGATAKTLHELGGAVVESRIPSCGIYVI